METCYQCKKQFEEQLPVVAIVQVDGASEEDKAIALAKAIGANDKEWMGIGMCIPCHNKPTVKAHFCFRPQMKIFLRNAGSTDLG